MPDWLTPFLTPGYFLAVVGFLWRLERRVYRIEIKLFSGDNGKGTS